MKANPFTKLTFELADLQTTDVAWPNLFDGRYRPLLDNDAILDRRLRALEDVGAELDLVGGGDVNSARVVYVTSTGACANASPGMTVPNAAFVKSVEGHYYGPGAYMPLKNLDPGGAYYMGADGELTVEPPRLGWVILVGIAVRSDVLQVRLTVLWRA